MQINPINQQLNFKQIILSEAEMKKAKSRYQYMLEDLKNYNHNYKMFDIFESHLNKEVDLKQYKTGKERKYFSNNLYIKFFEILETTKFQNFTLESFIDNLNNYINSFIIKKTPESDYYKLQDYNVSSAKTSARLLSEYLNMTKEDFLKLAQKTPFFPNTFFNYLKLNTNNLIERLGFTEEECIDLYKRYPKAMACSSQFLIDNANNTMKILEIESQEKLREILKNNPYLLDFKNLEFSIQNIAEFLDVEANEVKTMIKTQPYLATIKFDHIKNNFYAMKDLLKVDREKMTEIAVMAPTTIAQPFNCNKKKYEDISKTLGILPETFYNKANSLPAMYRTTTGKLERYIDFIMKKFDYNREEAIDYIAQNLNILSYKYSNMVSRTDANFKILNQNLGIDYDTYIYLLEENAWIMGHKEDFISKNIEDIKEYFNIDKETQKRMFENNPQLITYFVENIDNDVTNASEYFNIDKEKYKNMCIKEPLLATRPIKHHQVDIPESAKIMGMTEKEFIEFGKKHPEFLAYDPEQIAELKKEGIKTLSSLQ